MGASLAGNGRADDVCPHRRRHDERLGVVHAEGFERAGRALYDGLAALDEVEHVHAAVRVVQNGLCEPVPPRLEELALVQAGALLDPAVAAGDLLDLADELAQNEVRVAVELDVLSAVLQVDGPGLAVQPHAVPVPELKVKM